MLSRIIEYFRAIAERNFFGVCQWWGDRFSIKSSKIRLFFIYTSFITFGSPLILYLAMAFLLEHRDYLKGVVRRKRVWDL